MSKNLIKFLKDKKNPKTPKTGTANIVTHTVYDPASSLAGSYNINKNNIPELYDILNDMYILGNNFSMTERLGDVCPLIIDLDFKYLTEIKERQYTQTTLQKLSVYLFRKIRELYKLSDKNQSHVWIMEKDTISKCDRVPYKMKDGLHLLFPNIIAEKKTYIKLIESILNDKDELDKLFKDTCIEIPSNPVNEIFDNHIYKPGNWFIYGSGKPNDLVYKLTNIFKIKDNIIEELSTDIFLNNPREIMNKNSVRSQTDINVEYIGPPILKKTISISNVNSIIDSEDIENMENIIKIKKKDIDFAKKLTNILSAERASDCKTWIDVGYCLHNISSKHLLNSWIIFSKKWIGYCNDDECKKQWEYMDNTASAEKDINIGTLVFWAKKDNPEEYERIKKESLKDFVDKSLIGEKTCGTHADVANVIYNFYKDLYVCCGLKDNNWYYFNELSGKWKQTEQGHVLRSRLSADIIDLYQHYSNFYKDKRGDDPLSEVYQIYDTKHTNSMKVMIKLKDSTYKDKIMKECKEKFYDADFMDKLNSKKTLLGFDNGIVDLKYETLDNQGNTISETIFREGRPDDYISLSVGYKLPISKEDLPINIEQIKENIVNINDYKEMNDGLDDFINKVLPEEAVREYTLRFLASCLCGEVREEKFYFWTGSGSNGKSKIIELIDSTLGEYSRPMDVSYLTTKRSNSAAASPELERIRYARFVSMSEPERDDQIYVGKMKQITGGDKMSSRGLFKDTTEFKPQFKIVLMCNELPRLAGNDGGVARRIEVVDFVSKFTDNPRPSANNPHQYIADLQLSEKLKQWNMLFMIKLLNYYNIYDKEGTNAPASVTTATSVYITENDIIQKWIMEDLSESDEVIKFNDLHDYFKVWCENEGIDQKKISKADLKKTLMIAQEKTKAGPPIFGKTEKEGAPNGIKSNPKFNFCQIEDAE